jgi:O-antigen ligase
MNYVAYAICLFLAVQCFQDEARLKLLATAIACFGAGVACFAMIQEPTSGGRLYWTRIPQDGGSIYGPYVNHNHYAGLMEMLAPIPLVLCLSASVPRDMRLLYGSATLAMAASIFVSGSRGGAVGFLAELLILAAIVGIRERRNPRRTWRNLLVLCGLLAALLFSLGNERVWAGLADLARGYNNEVAGGRWAIDRDALRMWAQKPLLGWGLGTFPTVFPQFRSFYSDLVTNQAHNDLLQIGVETGILGFSIMLGFVLLLWRSGLRRSRLHRSFSSAVTLGALIACTGLLVHSLADFNLHIPANAAWFFFL